MAAKFSTALSLVLLALSGCGSPAPERPVEPLLDDQHLPDLLTESRHLAPPPDFSGNRLVRGWFPWKHEETRVWVPASDGAVLEWVNLSGRARSLELETKALGEVADLEVQVEIGDRPAITTRLEPSTLVPLPADLPRGRVPVRLVFRRRPIRSCSGRRSIAHCHPAS